MEAISEQLKDDIYPIADLRWKGGWRASIIVEIAIERVERDLKQITLEMWTRYASEYFEARETEERKLAISEMADNAISKFITHLEKLGFPKEQLSWAGKPNKKLVISMCLSYVYERIQKK